MEHGEMVAGEPILLHPIGVIATPYTDKYAAPRQPGADNTYHEGLITVHPGCNYEQALEDLSGFERIWALYLFHHNPNWKPKVLPPRGPGVRRGVFATRSPHRPNPIGMSVLTLLGIKGRTLHVGNVDLLDGTPILDIKPYVPYADAHPDSRAGWLDEVMRCEDEGGMYQVTWSETAREQAEWLLQVHNREVAVIAEQTLQRSPYPHPYRRITDVGEGVYQLAVKSWRLLYIVHDSVVYIQHVASGYSLTRIMEATPDTLHDHRAHQEFHTRWP